MRRATATRQRDHDVALRSPAEVADDLSHRSEPAGATGHPGRFKAGPTNAGSRLVLAIPGFDIERAAPWLQPHLRLAQRRYRATKLSGLLKRTGGRLDGLLRAAVISDATHDALVSCAATQTDVAEARGMLVEARAAAREARAAWTKLFALVGHTKGRNDNDNPLDVLARSLGSDDDNNTGSDSHDSEGDDL